MRWINACNKNSEIGPPKKDGISAYQENSPDMQKDI